MKRFTIIFCMIAISVGIFFYARRTSPIFNFVFPPQDMFHPLAKSESDMTQRGSKVQLEFKPKYPGNHELDLVVEKLDPGESLKGKIVLSVLLKNAKNKQINTKMRPYGSFWSVESKGFPLVSFNVPTDLEIGETGTVEVTVSDPDPDFPKTYGAAQLVVRKGAHE